MYHLDYSPFNGLFFRPWYEIFSSVTELPSLSGLRAFEAAARQQSFTRAARELHVTQGAISHQIRALERELGLELFVRMHRSIALTPAGQRLARATTDGLTRIADAVAALTPRIEDEVLSVSVSPSFAARWLVPRLARFRRLQPETDVRISANDALIDPEANGIDLCIRYGKGSSPGLVAAPLLADDVSPVCHPSFLEGESALREPADLAQHLLLHDEMLLDDPDRPDWDKWFRAAKLRGIDTGTGPRFSHAALALEAAVAGQGVALGRTSLVTDDIASGRLVRPFDVSFRARISYWLVTPPAPQIRARTQRFREWLLAEAGALRSQPRPVTRGPATRSPPPPVA
jgi:LysR family glycine cleavage system transcriptional activator